MSVLGSAVCGFVFTFVIIGFIVGMSLLAFYFKVRMDIAGPVAVATIAVLGAGGLIFMAIQMSKP